MSLLLNPNPRASFQNYHAFCSSPEHAQERLKAKSLAIMAKTVFKVMMVASAAFTTACVLSLTPAYPILGTMILLMGLADCVFMHDLAAVCEKEAELLSDEGLLGNLTTKYLFVNTYEKYLNFIKQKMLCPSIVEFWASYKEVAPLEVV